MTRMQHTAIGHEDGRKDLWQEPESLAISCFGYCSLALSTRKPNQGASGG